jgi:hypothetical protein
MEPLWPNVIFDQLVPEKIVSVLKAPHLRLILSGELVLCVTGSHQELLTHAAPLLIRDVSSYL